MYSIWFFAFLGCSGDLFNLAVTEQLINAATAPAQLVAALHWISFLGGASRLIKQKALELQAEQDASS